MIEMDNGILAFFLFYECGCQEFVEVKITSLAVCKFYVYGGVTIDVPTFDDCTIRVVYVTFYSSVGG